MSEPNQASNAAVKIKIPLGVDFADLQLAFDENGDMCYDAKPIEAICQASGLDVSHFRDGPEENLRGLIAAWYLAHRKHGGVSNPIAEEFFGG